MIRLLYGVSVRRFGTLMDEAKRGASERGVIN
jgi:hypothetical protein